MTDQQHAAVIYYNRIFPARNNEINPSVNGGGNGKAFKLTEPLPLSLSLSFAHLLCLIHSSANLLIIRGRLAIRYRQTLRRPNSYLSCSKRGGGGELMAHERANHSRLLERFK